MRTSQTARIKQVVSAIMMIAAIVIMTMLAVRPLRMSFTVFGVLNVRGSLGSNSRPHSGQRRSVKFASE